jgi:hypothetical protein
VSRNRGEYFSFIDYNVSTRISTLNSSGVLGSPDSITGAPENHAGEAVEQEASNFVANFTSIAVASAVGKNPQASGEGAAVTVERDDGKGEKKVGEENPASLEKSIPDPTIMVGAAKDSRSVHDGNDPGHDKTKEAMSAVM